MEVAMLPAKEKRRNSEKRKEKSRDAARFRRSRESEIFSNLSQVLPLPTTVTSHLDKASVMRLVIAHLRIRDLFDKMSLKDEKPNPDVFDSLYLKALGGVILVLSLDGEIIYVSSNVPSYLGVSQVDLLGHSIYDVSHPCDHNEIRDLLSGKVVPEGQISVFLRLKCTHSSKGRNLNIKSASYKVLHVSGNFVSANEEKDCFRFVTIAHPIPHPVDIEAPLGTYTFLSKHSLDMKFTYADERMADFLGYNPDSLIGKSLYNFHHAQDNKGIETAFKSLFAKGQSETGHYRFLAQGGGYAWVFTQATVIYCEKGNKPQSVVCVNYVLSEKLNGVEIYSYDQLEWNKNSQKTSEEKLSSPPKVVVEQVNTEQSRSRPERATRKIFAPKTKDMNTRFLVFNPDEDSGYTVMKDDPEDLTHLAPTAGDACVPLLPPVSNNFLIPNSKNYSPLLNEEKETPLFSSYRDDCSTGSLSPALTQSPGESSLPSLCGLDEDPNFEESMKSILGIDIVDPESDDLSSRAPYIPMGELAELPLLMPSDILWNVHYTFGCGSNESSGRCSPSPLSMKSVEEISTLADLLQVGKEDSLNKYPDQGGGNRTAFTNSPGKHAVDWESRKRVSTLDQDSAKKRKSTIQEADQGGGNSVLMNLLVAGQDVSAGYVCASPRRSPLKGMSKRET